MQYDLGEVEDEILELLEPLKSTHGVKTIKAYQGELEAPDFSTIISFFPAVFLFYSGSDFETANRRETEDQTWSLFVADRSFRGDKQARRGSTRGIGTYALLGAVSGVLSGKKAGGGVLSRVRNTPVAYSSKDGISIYESVFTIKQL